MKENINFKNNKKKQNKNLLNEKYKIKYKKYNFNVIVKKNILLLEKLKIIKFNYFKIIEKIIFLKDIIEDEQIIKYNIQNIILNEINNKILIYKKNIFLNIKKINKIIPIVTITGHVNHGKTSLLDFIISSKIILQESGNITQHISSYSIKKKKGNITFFDTPGHEAFFLMRKRGIKNTDIVILVIAADDGVMPQTLELIKFIKKFKVPLIIAINKIDKINLNLNIIKNELAKNNIISEEWGGDIQFINISSKTGFGINNLIESIFLQSEILEYKKKNISYGIIIESYYDKDYGPIAIILIKNGILKEGDIVLYNLEYGIIRSITNIFGKKIKIVGSSIPIEIIGLPIVPKIESKIFFFNENEKIKENIINKIEYIKKTKINLNDNFLNFNKNKILIINILLKTDVLGTFEVIKNELLKLSNDKININIINSNIGNITKNDLILALNNNAIVLGFNVSTDISEINFLELNKINIKFYNVIYKLIDDIKKEIYLLLNKNKIEIIGSANVCNVFKYENIGIIAGCIVLNGNIECKNKIKILRKNKIIYEGVIESLRHYKKIINNVTVGMECGIYIKNYTNFKIGDKVEVFK